MATEEAVPSRAETDAVLDRVEQLTDEIRRLRDELTELVRQESQPRLRLPQRTTHPRSSIRSKQNPE